MARIKMVDSGQDMGTYESAVVPAVGDQMIVERAGSRIGRLSVDGRTVQHEVDSNGNVVEETWILNVTLLP